MLFFTENQKIITQSATGRMDVMGGIADYSGSLVLQMPIKEKATVKVAFRNDQLLRVYSKEIDATFTTNEIAIPADYSKAKQFFKKEKGGDWAAYILGCWVVLKKEHPIIFAQKRRGVDFYLDSEVPIGKGVSSSAAIEVATMRALNELYQLNLDNETIAILAQKAENLVVGAPCGIMDQLACSLGEKNHLLPIVCQPNQVFQSIPIPEGIQFTGIDSGVRHVVSGASYGDVRVAAFMGYSIIANANGIATIDLLEAKTGLSKSNLPYRGYLCNIRPKEFEKRYAALLPKEIVGAEFLDKYGISIDPITKVEKNKVYQVKACTKHPIYENSRVKLFEKKLNSFTEDSANQEVMLKSMGKLMYAAHQSYSDCGLGNVQTDRIVELVQQAGIESGVYGAKITGGGSGGTVCVLSFGEKGVESVKHLFEIYQKETGEKLKLIE